MTARGIAIGRLVAGIIIFGGWELYGRLGDSTWTSMPSAIVDRLFQMGPLTIAGNAATTLYEMACGMIIGVPLGLLGGLVLGRRPRLAALLSPFLIGGNSIPLPALAPLFILWFGLGVAPKVALVALVTFFLMFFTALAGARAVDDDMINSIVLMGGSRGEIFRKVIAPASVAWVFAGLKNAVPYGLIAATVGEILLSRSGIGFLISDAAQNFDMTELYTALFILIVFGAALNALLAWLERHLLRWRG